MALVSGAQLLQELRAYNLSLGKALTSRKCIQLPLLLQLYSLCTAPRTLLHGFGASLAGINHGSPLRLGANYEEAGLDAVASATKLQTCLDPRPSKMPGGRILGQGLQEQS